MTGLFRAVSQQHLQGFLFSDQLWFWASEAESLNDTMSSNAKEAPPVQLESPARAVANTVSHCSLGQLPWAVVSVSCLASAPLGHRLLSGNARTKQVKTWNSNQDTLVLRPSSATDWLCDVW